MPGSSSAAAKTSNSSASFEVKLDEPLGGVEGVGVG
jgi:hypothetical protein